MRKTRVLIQPLLDSDKETFIVPLASTLRGVRKVKLLQAAWANTTYNVQLGLYDSMQVIVGGIEHFVTIPPGAYNIETIFSRLKMELDSLNVGTWNFIYNASTFGCTITNTASFQIVLQSRSVAYLLGFAGEPQYSSSNAMRRSEQYTTAPLTVSTGEYAVRLNTNRGVLLTLKGFETLDCPNLNTSASWFLPVFCAAGDLNFVSASDLGKQACIRAEDGHDLSTVEISVRRTDFNLPYELGSDSSFVFEFTHD